MTRIALFLSMLLLVKTIICQNHMDLIQTMSGEFAGSEFGITMVSMDFNGDGFKDIIVSSSGWNPYSVYADSARFGKIYFYWGGPSFDNIPDFVMAGSYFGEFATLRGDLINAGDVNGDGIDDLALVSNFVNNDLRIAIYYGRQNPQIVPDIVRFYPTTGLNYIQIYPLGDINGDGHDDLALTFQNDGRYNNTLMIWTDIASQPWFFRMTSNQTTVLLMNGIGDINNDGLDDSYMQLPIDGMGNINRRIVAYYGNANFPSSDSLVISSNTNQVTQNWGCPLGDVNGDGFDDFIAYLFNVWKGSPNLTPIWDLTLESSYGLTESGSGLPFVYGDLNNDGYDDIIGTNHLYGYWSGVANIWLGRSQMNGIQDLVIFPPVNYENRNFGWAKAVGDFNADGYDDIAVSAPWWAQGGSNHNELGKVFVYAGNAQLADTTVGIEDEQNPVQNVSEWEIILSPNPLSDSNIQLNVKFTGSAYKNAHRLNLSIFDVKGRKVISQLISESDLNNGNLNLMLTGKKPGMYIVNISDNKKYKLITKKITIK